MVLNEHEFKKYMNVHLRLLHYCYCKKHKLKNELSLEQFIKKTLEVKYEARNFFLNNLFLLDEYLRENYTISKSEKEILYGFKKKLSSKYVILKQLKNYAIFLDIESDKFYAVIALSDPFSQMLDNFPVLIETTLLPFEGKIIYDGFFVRIAYIGKNIERNMLNKYQESRTNKLIIKSIG